MMKAKLIKTESDYKAALERIEAIFDARPGTPEGDELELLVTLVEMYEAKAFPIDMPDPLSAIRFRMDQQGLKPVDLVPYIGSRPRVSEVLSGKRPLSLSMIRKLTTGLGIPAEVLLKEPHTQKRMEESSPHSRVLSRRRRRVRRTPSNQPRHPRRSTALRVRRLHEVQATRRTKKSPQPI